MASLRQTRDIITLAYVNNDLNLYSLLATKISLARSMSRSAVHIVVCLLVVVAVVVLYVNAIF